MAAAYSIPAAGCPQRVSGEHRLDDAQIVALLVRRCVAGDAAAWEEIVQKFNRRIYNICYRFAGGGEDAEDLTQEVFIKIYRTMASFDPEKASFNTWVTTVTRNLLVDHFRKTKNDRVTDSMDAPIGGEDEGQALSEKIEDKGLTPDQHVQKHQTQKLVQEALQKLSPELREAVILRDLQDMDYREIAQILRIPEGTVKSRINRGRTELARLLQRTYRQVS
jgi:RNA polymerase sigma-70 factor (ECF subfamily)